MYEYTLNARTLVRYSYYYLYHIFLYLSLRNTLRVMDIIEDQDLPTSLNDTINSFM